MAKIELNTSSDEIEHFNRQERSTREIIQVLFDMAATLIALGYLLHGAGIFRIWSGKKKMSFSKKQPRVQKIQKQAAVRIEALFQKAFAVEWKFSNSKNDKFAKETFPRVPDSMLEKYFNANMAQSEAFLKRKRGGRNLSDRVWKLTEQTKLEVEALLDKAITEGESAQLLKVKLKRYLNNPEFFLPKDFKPGPGVYRSSIKNAQRLARTEINHAYRMADYERWQQLPFIVGFEIKRSNNYVNCPVCDGLAGKYPKDFLWLGNHPSCRCKAIPILKTVEELKIETNAILAGKEPSKESKNTVSDLSLNAKLWFERNKHRFKNPAKLPYIIADNPKYFKL